jgi:aspartyl-tRNA(Asn)/glutamyl-tRNA(Gln) amidotransferase subunit C
MRVGVSLSFFVERRWLSVNRTREKVQDASPLPASRGDGAPPRITPVIDREQVLHVARLARLRLSEAEVETMAGELSGILEHVDRIGKLDLDGVEPTSHVVELENVLRPDVPRPSWPKEMVLEPAPDPVDGAFRVPSPQAEA